MYNIQYCERDCYFNLQQDVLMMAEFSYKPTDNN